MDQQKKIGLSIDDQITEFKVELNQNIIGVVPKTRVKDNEIATPYLSINDFTI